MDTPNITREEMLKNVARFNALRGSEQAFVDSRNSGSKRKKINIIGNGVVESDDPALRPNIQLPAYGFNVGMIIAEHGNGAALHSHKTEEVFMPLIGNWAVIWRNDKGDQEIILEPYDTIHVPVRIYRGFRYIGEGKGVLLTIIGGPDAGHVTWAHEVLEAAAATGLDLDSAGNLIDKTKAA